MCILHITLDKYRIFHVLHPLQKSAYPALTTVRTSLREAPFSKILRRRVFGPWYLRAAQCDAEAEVAQPTKVLHAENVALPNSA